MRFDYINPFIDSAHKVLEQTLASPVQRGRLTLAAQPVTSKGIVTLVGLAGEVEGRVIFDMDQPTALRIVSAMNGDVFEEFTSFAQDSLVELASMMIGNAVTALNDHGFRFRLTPPTLLQGEKMTIVPSPLETLVAPLGTRMGEVIMNVALRTS
ncbi:MAG: chemotaxis protein CheX [Candidatus Methylomirabilales bacterium]